MKKLANYITAVIYIFIMKKITDKTKEELLDGDDIYYFGGNLVLSSLTFLMLMLILFVILIMITSQIIKFFIL